MPSQTLGDIVTSDFDFGMFAPGISPREQTTEEAEALRKAGVEAIKVYREFIRRYGDSHQHLLVGYNPTTQQFSITPLHALRNS